VLIFGSLWILDGFKLPILSHSAVSTCNPYYPSPQDGKRKLLSGVDAAPSERKGLEKIRGKAKTFPSLVDSTLRGFTLITAVVLSRRLSTTVV
jgi:hypothetical protein